MLKYLAAAYQEKGQIHWPTLLAATSGIAGEMALLAKEVDLPERGYVLGKNVSRFLCDDSRSPKSVWGYCLLIANEAFGLKKSALPDFRETESRITVSLAANPDFVPLSDRRWRGPALSTLWRPGTLNRRSNVGDPET